MNSPCAFACLTPAIPRIVIKIPIRNVLEAGLLRAGLLRGSSGMEWSVIRERRRSNGLESQGMEK
jgi:hypothetical protein